MRRFSSRGRRPRIPVQWLPGSNSWDQGGVVVAATTLTAINLVKAEAGATGGIPAIARMTIRNIRGQLGVIANAGGGILSCGIIVQPTGNVGQYQPNPGLAADADGSWLWLRHFSFPSFATSNRSFMNDQQLPMGTEINVRVKRVLRPNEDLQLLMFGTVAVTVYPFLRTLISRVA